MKIWFLERESDGRIEQMGERQAYETLHNPNSSVKWSVIGVADGRSYGEGESQSILGEEHIRVLEEGMKDIDLSNAELSTLKKSQERYFEAIEKLMYEDFLDADDPKVKRGRVMLDRVNEKIEEITNKPSAFGLLNQRAFNAQVEACRGNIIMPSKASLVSGDPYAVELFMKTNKS